ncbi:hypothetical protein [Streptomyces sp. NBC_01235]|uniref:hypothetical protein n=1 Tax=Streptomyces sp. NBC_01235 TaxID=2903788 RepID=UPI002E108D54|nr:hypothetical protein OG289_48825 [Streptomyces sp. NBC_01235]
MKGPQHRDPINLLVTLRNFAAHESPKSKAAALKQTGGKNLGSAGSWVKPQRRVEFLLVNLEKVVGKIQAAAPY